MPLNSLTVGVDKIGDLAWIAATVRTLNCESPHVSHIPHLGFLVGLGLGWASWGNSFQSVTSTPFNSTVFLWLKSEENKTERINLHASKSSDWFSSGHTEFLIFNIFMRNINFIAISSRFNSSTEDQFLQPNIYIFRGRYSSNISNSSATYRKCVHLWTH